MQIFYFIWGCQHLHQCATFVAAVRFTSPPKGGSCSLPSASLWAVVVMLTAIQLLPYYNLLLVLFEVFILF
jgi:hypothetical protein